MGLGEASMNGSVNSDTSRRISWPAKLKSLPLEECKYGMHAQLSSGFYNA